MKSDTSELRFSFVSLSRPQFEGEKNRPFWQLLKSTSFIIFTCIWRVLNWPCFCEQTATRVILRERRGKNNARRIKVGQTVKFNIQVLSGHGQCNLLLCRKYYFDKKKIKRNFCKKMLLFWIVQILYHVRIDISASILSS